MKKNRLGQSALEVTPICFGTSGLGDMPDTYGYAVDEGRARRTLDAIFEGPVDFLDTSRNYGMGRSEARIGDAIRAHGGLPEGFVISTKLDRGMDDNRFDADRARRSLEESLTALGLDRVHILHLHDPEYAADLDDITREGGAMDELFKIKEEGLADAVGLAMGRIDLMFSLLRRYPFDCLITHNRYSLLNRQADEMMTYAHGQGMAVFNAAPYAGGVLAKGADAMPRVTYQEADEATLAPVRAIEKLCADHGVAMGAAALQFSMHDPRIASTIIGVTKPSRVAETLEWASADIPDAFWTELKSLGYDSGDPEANRVYKPG